MYNRILRTHCSYGHEFNEANTRWARGGRICRQCERRKKSLETITTDKAELVLAALRGGQTLATVIGRSKRKGFAGTGIVNSNALRNYRRAHPDFDHEVLSLSSANVRATSTKGHRQRAQTHCKRGHPLSGDNLYVYGPLRYRKCIACAKYVDATGRRMTEDKARRVVAGLMDGKTISQVTKSGPDYVVNATALVLFRRRNPKFDKMVTRMSAANAKIHHEEAAIRQREIYRARVVQPNADEIFARVRSAVPASLGALVQAEVIASMSLAVIEGRIQPRQIEGSVREFVRDYYRQYSNYGPVSLDRPLFQDSSMTLGDTVTRGLWG